MADPDFELKRGPGSILLAQPAFLLSVISLFFSPKLGGRGRGDGGEGGGPLLDLPLYLSCLHHHSHHTVINTFY